MTAVYQCTRKYVDISRVVPRSPSSQMEIICRDDTASEIHHIRLQSGCISGDINSFNASISISVSS